ncbi:hypothetical protein [Haloferula sp.]|uniref:hypothetical protein n=1 Tax=Haloferula sp. TaxID=2497595 RepID=UPI00329B1A52
MKEYEIELQILEEVAACTKLDLNDVAAVLDGLAAAIRAQVKMDQIFTFTVPGLMEIETYKRRVPQVSINPSTKETRGGPARSGTLVVRIRPDSLEKKPKPTKKNSRMELEILEEVAGNTNLDLKKVAAVLLGLGTAIRTRTDKNLIFTFTVPGLMGLKTHMRSATPAREGINPFTKEMVIFPACPATLITKIRPNSIRRKPRKTLTKILSEKPR